MSNPNSNTTIEFINIFLRLFPFVLFLFFIYLVLMNKKIVLFIQTITKEFKFSQRTLKIISTAFIILLFLPCFINEFYKVGSINGVGFITEWNAEGLLSFYGNFLSFVGTISLGILAFWQNEKIREEANESNKTLTKENNELKKLNEQSNRINLKMLKFEESKYMPIINIKPEIEYNDLVREHIGVEFFNCGKGDISHTYITQLNTSEISEYKCNINTNFDITYETLHDMVQKRTNNATPNEISNIILIDGTHEYSCHKEYGKSPNSIEIVLLLQMTNLYGNEFFEILTFEVYSTINSSRHYNRCRNVKIKIQGKEAYSNL